ncbi:NPCBM/NEW2 domain-containing protein [Neptunicella marina]|uniref:Alpha-galactosidase n=1 Tax=Neptunicella marina TaxID=2125989 RepID=A0A8J6IV68_9ALTE|nr:NPCBM/NEW2 domain-containing protein [Neptunicella marina]MBC3766377.1 NPCBM/NEW2 domain-containing protein [Neptunicella marina]
MKGICKTSSFLFLSSALLASCASVSGTKTQSAASLQPSGQWTAFTNGQAATPPMGWNSWNAFHTDVNEEKVLGAAQKLLDSGLADLGYRYINIDDGWWLKRRQSDNTLVVRTAIFPSAVIQGAPADQTSFKPFVDHIHAMGLKAGIYTDIGRNACSQAYNLTSPNLPEGTQAEREVGTYGFVDQDMKLYFADWGFDYIKVDACGIDAYAPEREHVKALNYRPMQPLIYQDNINLTDSATVQNLYETLQQALIKYNPDGDFVYSICNWGSANVRQWGKDVGNMWRTSGDIVPVWSRMLHSVDSVITRSLYAGPGTWNDPDMLYIGKGDFDEHHLTEAKSQFALWAILSAPLLIGYDLRHAPDALMDIWGADEIVAVNQDPAGNQGVLAYNSDDVQIIVKTLAKTGEKAVAIFNRGLAPIKVQLTAAHLKMAADQTISLRDLWEKRDLGSFKGETTIETQPRQTVILKAKGNSELTNGIYLSEMPGRVNVAEDGVTAPMMDPNIHKMVDPWGMGTRSGGQRPQYAGWGGARADSTPYNENIRMQNTIYRSGIGALANSRLEVKANAEFNTFSAQVGIDDSSPGKSAPVQFEIYGDGKLLETSVPTSFNQTPVTLSADVTGVKVVELIARQMGPAHHPVVVAWANAKLQ